MSSTDLGNGTAILGKGDPQREKKKSDIINKMAGLLYCCRQYGN